MKTSSVDFSPAALPRRSENKPETAIEISATQDSVELGADPLQVAYARAQRRFGAIPGAEITVTSCPASGGFPIVVLKNHNHPADQPAKPSSIQVHFHGEQLYDKDVHYDDEIGKAVERAWSKDSYTVLVLPEARNEDAAPRSDWNNISSVSDLVAHSLKAAKLGASEIGPKFLSGHSAGGSVVAKAIARAASDLAVEAELQSYQHIELYDAAVSSQNNPVGDAERSKIQAWCKQKPSQFVVMPGIMKSSWLDYVDKSRWTEKAADHWTPLWSSLGQFREPKAT